MQCPYAVSQQSQVIFAANPLVPAIELLSVFYQEQEGGTLLLLTRVELIPETGRIYQLRIHCQQLGHPIWAKIFKAVSCCQAQSGRRGASVNHPPHSGTFDAFTRGAFISNNGIQNVRE